MRLENVESGDWNSFERQLTLRNDKICGLLAWQLWTRRYETNIAALRADMAAVLRNACCGGCEEGCLDHCLVSCLDESLVKVV